MPFPYYHNLRASEKRIYRESDAIESITVKDPAEIYPVVVKLKESLEQNKRRDVAKYASGICRLVCDGMHTETLVVKISSRRPSNSTRELHGLYERTDGEPAVLTVWMKTAAKGQVVAFKSFIRTILHELCHHLDYTHFALDDSFHTEGFFKRESSLYRQIVPEELQKREPRPKKTVPEKKKDDHGDRGPEQIELF